jgi:hypothetical protein
MLIRQQRSSKPLYRLFLREMPIPSDAPGDKYISTLISSRFRTLRFWAFPHFVFRTFIPGRGALIRFTLFASECAG